MMLDTKDGNLQHLNEEVDVTKEQVAKKETPEETIESAVNSDEKSEVEVVDEIEEKIAKSSEKEEEHKEDEMPSYEGMSLEKPC